MLWLRHKPRRFRNHPTSRRMMEQVLEKEEEHANDLSDLLTRIQ